MSSAPFAWTPPPYESTASKARLVSQMGFVKRDYAGGVGRGDDLETALQNHRPQVLVDFTHPSAGLDNALAAVAAGAAPVVGTSGIPAEDIERLERACAERGVGGIVAPNFAVGAVLMMWLAERAAPFFDAADVIEMHHAAKADAPSGTAVATARRMGVARERPFAYSRTEKVVLEGARGAESEGVAVHSVRLPGVLAEQEVILGLPGQTLTIAHRTISRECYAPGVLLAIRRVASGPGFFRGLEPLLGLA
ncbi:MAG: 4-hydroxy-tetrahydrodipicolinate reductase [Chloroflexi bacterium]|nr:MAG: 4-hydroxy-tetrahydrodipicolinate reductase [Chloroflexota bacterium]